MGGSQRRFLSVAVFARKESMRRDVLALILVLSAAQVPVGVSAQGGSGDKPLPPIEFSSWPMRRDVSLITAGGEFANIGADAVLKRAFGEAVGTSWQAVVKRLSRLYFVNLPIAGLAHTAAHEIGHVARAGQTEEPVVSVRVTRWPWPIPFANAVFTRQLPSASSDPSARLRESLGVLAGGEEASQVQEESLTAELLTNPKSGYFRWASLLYAKLDFPLYAWSSLRESELHDFSAFVSSTHYQSDPPQYAHNLALLRAPVGSGIGIDDVRAVADQIRRGVWLNLADATLWTAVGKSVQHIATGRVSSEDPGLRIGGFRFLPAGHFAMTPLGLEHGAGVLILSHSELVNLTTRWIDTPQGHRLWRGGGELIARGRGLKVPEVRIDVWQREALSLGFRLELGTGRSIRVAQAARLSFSVGYKTSGYLAGASDRSGMLGAVKVRFGS